MTYLQDTGEVNALYRPAGEVDSVTMKSGTVARFLAPGSVTNGRFGLFQWDMLTGVGGASPHFHRTFSESFYVLSGSVQLYNGERWTEGKPGDFFHVPDGGVHAFRNESGAPASMLILFAPGIARERFFEELAEIGHSGRQLSEDEWTELFARHDQYRA